MEQKLVRHHLDVFLNHFKPTKLPMQLEIMPGLFGILSVTGTIARELERQQRVWSIRAASPWLNEITLSAGAYPTDQVLGYVVTDFPHFGCPIHFRVVDIRNQITEQGAKRSFSRIIRRLRYWMIHTLPPEVSKDYQNQLDLQLAESRQP